MSYRVLYDALLPDVLEAFPEPFACIPYENPEALAQLLQQDDIVLCRSTLKAPTTSMQICKPRIIATASSGSDNFDKTALKSLGISFLDARGCNRESVADYALCCLAIIKQARGTLASPIGIVGLGAVGETVAKRLAALGLDLVLFDPPRALYDVNFKSDSEAALLKCPIIFLHANLHREPPFETYHWFHRERLAALSDGSIVINLARGALVDEAALLAETSRIGFISDVFEHEPHISYDMVAKSLFCTPHIAGHSLEGKREAIRILSQKIHTTLKLTPPSFQAFPKVKATPAGSKVDGLDDYLSLYDPRLESAKLKAASPENLTETFLNLRKAHNFRHNFSCIAGFQ